MNDKRKMMIRLFIGEFYTDPYQSGSLTSLACALNDWRPDVFPNVLADDETYNPQANRELDALIRQMKSDREICNFSRRGQSGHGNYSYWHLADGDSVFS